MLRLGKVRLGKPRLNLGSLEEPQGGPAGAWAEGDRLGEARGGPTGPGEGSRGLGSKQQRRAAAVIAQIWR